MKDVEKWIISKMGKCPQCGDDVLKNHPKQKFCSYTCASKWHRAERKRLIELGRKAEKGPQT